MKLDLLVVSVATMLVILVLVGLVLNNYNNTLKLEARINSLHE